MLARTKLRLPKGAEINKANNKFKDQLPDSQIFASQLTEWHSNKLTLSVSHSTHTFASQDILFRSRISCFCLAQLRGCGAIDAGVE